MLSELRIENFAIIDHLELDFKTGLVILTGETGAGKSIILDAIMALLGGKFDSTSIRSDSAKARVEAVFKMEDCPPELLKLLSREELLDNDQFVTIEREIRMEGRSSARINGLSVNLNVLREVGDLLVDIHGQSEHLSLMNTRQHIGLLDRYAKNQDELRRYQQQYRQLMEVRREIKDLRQIEAEAASRIELLTFQEQEISTARLEAGEDALLDQERNRLANSENLANAAQQALMLLDDPTPDMPSITDLLGQLAHHLQNLARYDPSQQDIADRGGNLLELAADLGRDLRSYVEQIEINPRRLEEIEERISLINNLKRKYGGSIESILAYRISTQENLEKINFSGERIVELKKQERTILDDLWIQAQVLSTLRKSAAEQLGKSIESELNELKMEGAQFQVQFDTLPGNNEHPANPNGLDIHGMDKLEFLIAPNPGEGLKPLVKIASGGETSRLMLALKNVLANEDQIPSLIFDEIDQGIGGRVGSIVGKKLWQLARSHQVFCVTHLPQLAAFGDDHFHVAKDVSGGRTTTFVTRLVGQQRITELAQMLGNSSETNLRSAEELLSQVGLMVSNYSSLG